MIPNFTRIVRLGVNEQNRGTCIVWKCPRCEVLRDFLLIRSQGNFTFKGVEFSRPVVLLDLRCAVCAYEVKVDSSEETLLLQTAELTKQLKEGTLSLAEYDKRLRSSSARFVNTLAALTESWKCSGCGEENPVTFDSCWKCRKKNSSPSTIECAGDEKLPGPPPGGNPWES